MTAVDEYERWKKRGGGGRGGRRGIEKAVELCAFERAHETAAAGQLLRPQDVSTQDASRSTERSSDAKRGPSGTLAIWA